MRLTHQQKFIVSLITAEFQSSLYTVKWADLYTHGVIGTIVRACLWFCYKFPSSWVLSKELDIHFKFQSVKKFGGTQIKHYYSLTFQDLKYNVAKILNVQ